MSTTTKWPRRIRNKVAAVRDALAELERRGRVDPVRFAAVLSDARTALDDLREHAGARVRAGDAGAVSMGVAAAGAAAALWNAEDALLKVVARDRRGRRNDRRRYETRAQ